ncbi:MAG: tripartite tricarboxylate transporter permease [Methanomassiliicoccales archaeon]|nr:tripartite tricarboxylate transporter permease [Methanomassiliicoccales archaeon]
MDVQVILCALLFSSAGSALGICSGMVPGLHVNTFSLILVSAFPLLEPPVQDLCASFSLDPWLAPLLLSCTIVSAAVTHSFLDFLPSLFLGVPEEGTVISVLPGHRLLLDGRAMDAVRCAALGSLLGALFGMLLVVPLQVAMSPPLSADSLIAPVVPWILVVVSVALVLSEARKAPVVAVLDCREGTIEPAPRTVSIIPARPVHKEEGELIGTVCRVGLPAHPAVRTPRGTVEFKSGAPRTGRVRLQGVWVIQRRRFLALVQAASLFLLSGALGLISMDARPPGATIFAGLGQSMLFPLLTGLFGFPSLLLSVRSGPIPSQVDESGELPPARTGLAGAFAGFIAGWLPGITSTAATVVTAPLANRTDERGVNGARRFLVSVSAVGTSATVFSVLAFVILGKVRSGSMAAVGQLLGGDSSSFGGGTLPLFLLSVLVGSAVGYVAMLWISRWIVRRLSGLRLGSLNRVLLVALTLMVLAFTGMPGLLLLIVATFVGLIPPRIGIGRVQLTGCLLLPITLALLGLDEGVTSALALSPFRAP